VISPGSSASPAVDEPEASLVVGSMKTRNLFPFRSLQSPRDVLRDPALWAWLAVALLAIIPARAVFAGH